MIEWLEVIKENIKTLGFNKNIVIDRSSENKSSESHLYGMG